MSEQQRIFITVLLCMGIFLGYQYLVGRTAPPLEAPTPDAVESAVPAAPLAALIPAPVAAPAAAIPLQTRQFETPLLRATLSNQSAGLTQVSLKNYHNKPADEGASEPVSLVAGDEPELAQARIAWLLPGAAPALHFVASPQEEGIVLQGETSQQMAVSVAVQPRQDAYALDYVLRVINQSSTPLPVGARLVLTLPGKVKEEGHSFLPGAKAPGSPLAALCDIQDDLERKEFSAVEKAPWSQHGMPRWVALDRQYFLVAAVLDPGGGARDPAQCGATARGDMLDATLEFAAQMVPPNGTWERRFSLYVGPKLDEQLSVVSPLLLDAVDYTIWHIPMGFLARPMVFLLNVFHRWTSSWGLAIVLLTLMVKILLLPITYKSAQSMRKMQLLKPAMDRIKTQFENDRERQQLEQIKLFKEKGVNPMGGCLPMLLQMPVGLALYRMLWSAVDLYHQPFLWLPDLTAKEPFPILALILGAITLLQQRMTPMATDNQQAKVMMYVLPAMMTFFMIALPSGLVVYILVNSILTIIQQLAINKRAVTV